MQVTETHAEGLKRAYEIVVGADAIEEKLTAKLKELSTQVRLPGFRPGKAPVSLLRKQYGQRLLGEVLEETVNESAAKALEEKEIRPALQPKIEITKFDEGQDLEYKVDVELFPEIEPGDFTEISVEKLTVAIADETVDERLNQMAQQMREFDDAADDHAAAEGDTVVIDFKGSIDGEAFDGGAAEDFSLELGSGRFIPGFEDQLVGVKKGEERTVAVDFPADYGAEDLAGKAAEFAVTVKGVKVPKDLEIDDALAEKLGLENLEALRGALRDQVAQEYGQLERARLKRNLLDTLAERYSFEVPEGMVDMEFEQIWSQMTQDLERQEKTLEDLEKPEEEARAEYRGIAERRVRLGLFLSEIGRLNNIEISQDEVNRAIAEQARQFPGQEKAVFEYFQSNPEAQQGLRAPILEDKVVDFILEMADVREREVSLDELMRDPDEDAESGSDETAA